MHQTEVEFDRHTIPVVVSRVLHICVFLALYSSQGQREDVFFLLGCLDIRLYVH